MIYSFAFFLLLFVLIGIASYRYSQPTVEDYLLASKDVKPWLAGLSLFSTENSAGMFVGYVGFVYAAGLTALWLPIGWYTAEIVMLFWAARKWREQTDVIDANTYSGLLSRWTGQEYKIVRYVAALVIIVFLSVYAAAQLGAGGKALNALIGWDVKLSAVIGFVIVVAYCFAGGIRASIWTDAVQTGIMFLSLIVIVFLGLQNIGGLDALFETTGAIGSDYLNLFAGDYKFGVLGFAAGWFFAGFGILGQPHVMTRIMVVDKPENAVKVALSYAVMVTIFAALCTVAALCARAILPDLADPELGLPMLSAHIMPGVLSGLFLAGLFAAAMSTADSQILASSAALTRDLVEKYKDSRLFTKAGTLFVASLALMIALMGNESVLKLVTFAWSFMSAAFVPLVIVYVLGKKPTQFHAILMMVCGVAASFAWEFAGWTNDMYNVFPGIVTGLAVYFLGAPFMKAKS